MPFQGIAGESFLPAHLEPAILLKIKHNLNPSKQETTSSLKKHRGWGRYDGGQRTFKETPKELELRPASGKGQGWVVNVGLA